MSSYKRSVNIWYKQYHPHPTNYKLRCVVKMVVDSLLTPCGPNDHRKDAPPFTNHDHGVEEIEKFRKLRPMGRSYLGLISNKEIPSSRNQKRDITLTFSGTDLTGNNVLDIPKQFNNRGFRSSDVIWRDFLWHLRSWIVFLCREILTRFYPSDLRLDSF